MAGRCDYLALNFNEASNFGHNPQPILEFQPQVYRLGMEDDIEFRFFMEIRGQVIDKTEWSRSPGAKLSTAGLTADNGKLLIEVRNNNAGGIVDRVEVRLRSSTPPKL